MNRILSLLAAAGLSALAPLAAAEVTVTIGEPGFYGQLVIGEMPRPAVIFVEPVVIERVTVVREPVYLRVPPGHEKDWGKHCSKYGACGRPVYFVRDSWYSDVYVPEYRRKHGGGQRHDKHHDDHDDHRGGGGDHKHGKGGKGKGRDKD